MKKLFIILAVASLMAACNSGNEGSDSIVVDSSRIADSIKLADSLRLVDTGFLMFDTAASQLQGADIVQQ
jgi:hypothetical protein